MTRFARTSLSVGLVALVAGCPPLEDDDAQGFRNGVPRTETVKMNVPGGGQALTVESTGQALTVESASQALLGEIAEYYKLTRGITVVVNGAALAVGGLVRLVLIHPPTSVTVDEAVWGPWEDPLDPVAWRVTVRRLAEHQYEYSFDGRPRHEPDAAFVTVLKGKHNPAVDANGYEVERFGSGSFTLDWDARATLPEPKAGEVGQVHYSYRHLGESDPVDIEARFRQVMDEDTKQLVDADYTFSQVPRAEGNMNFVYIVPDNPAKPGGRAAVHSRWMFSGAGRSDAKIKGNDGRQLVVSECWDKNFSSVYKKEDWVFGASWGLESDCPFSAAEYSTLSL
jgi:hypothetical protein